MQLLNQGIPHFQGTGKTDQNRRQTAKTIENGHQLGHFSHLDSGRQVKTHPGTNNHADCDQGKTGNMGMSQRGHHRHHHTNNAVYIAVFCRILPAQSGQTHDKHQRSRQVGRHQ